MKSRRSTIWRWLLALAIIIVAALVAYVWQPTIDPVQTRAARQHFSDEQVLLGQDVAAAGMCVVCHTSDNGERYAGGHAMETPFGIVYATNITPDPETGIGSWSFEAFERAMRRGVAHDGRYLYPAFPYTAYTHMSHDDMQALYAYMMSLPPVDYEPPETELPFPFNIRPLMAGWNLLFLDKGPIEIDADETQEWNRGNYLTRALAHCAGCHSPRNQFGAEKDGIHFLAGGEAEGWYAPALNAASPAPIPWTEQALFDYLRHGYADSHGSAAGSMAPVVREGTAKMPEEETRAMATFLASLMPPSDDGENTAMAEQQSQQAMATLRPPQSEGATIFASACLACHDGGKDVTVFGAQTALWLSSPLYLDEPDNVIRIILDGVQEPASATMGYMAPFRNSLSDTQIVALLRYMRRDLANMPEWDNLIDSVARIRRETQPALAAGMGD